MIRKFYFDDGNGGVRFTMTMDEEDLFDQLKVDSKGRQYIVKKMWYGPSKKMYLSESHHWMPQRKDGNWTTPLRSESMGTNVEQIPEQIAADRRLGLDTEYDPVTGDALFRNRSHRNRHLRAHGFVDRDGGYGDVTHNSEPWMENE